MVLKIEKKTFGFESFCRLKCLNLELWRFWKFLNLPVSFGFALLKTFWTISKSPYIFLIFKSFCHSPSYSKSCRVFKSNRPIFTDRGSIFKIIILYIFSRQYSRYVVLKTVPSVVSQRVKRGAYSKTVALPNSDNVTGF